MAKDDEEAELTGASALCAVAAASGVEVCFANPGTTEMHIVGALSEAKNIRSVLVLHENVATGAADGFSRIATRDRNAMAMTLLHLAPGLMNGLSNLHNAFRARSSILNVVGDMSTFHRGVGALLEGDIESLAKTVSKTYVHTVNDANAVASHTVDAIEAAKNRSVSTLVVPHDVSWSTANASELETQLKRTKELKELRHTLGTVVSEDIKGFFRQLIARAKDLAPSELLFYIGGDACGADELRIVGEIASALSADIVCECFFTSIARGGDLRNVPVRRAPYLPKDAAAAFAKYKVVCFLDVPKPPVAMFGYEDAPRELFTQGEDDVWIIDPPGKMAMIDILRAIASELDLECGVQAPMLPDIEDVRAGVEAIVFEVLGKPIDDSDDSLWNHGMTSTKAVSCQAKLCKDFDVKLQTTLLFDHNTLTTLTRAVATKLGVSTSPSPHKAKRSPPSALNVFPTPDRDDALIEGALDGSKVCKIVASMQPKGCVVVDESLTSGSTYWNDSASCDDFTHMTLTGGSIGFSLSAAVGASIAAPDRRVITLVGDGSAHYTIQALWTQAREKLNVTTVIMNNAKYQILRVECAIQGVQPSSGDACDALTDIGDVDWVKIAEGYGVRGICARNAREFKDAFKLALETDGPVLIEAVLSD